MSFKSDLTVLIGIEMVVGVEAQAEQLLKILME